MQQKIFKCLLDEGIVLATTDSNVKRQDQSSLGADSLKEAQQIQ